MLMATIAFKDVIICALCGTFTYEKVSSAKGKIDRIVSAVALQMYVEIREEQGTCFSRRYNRVTWEPTEKTVSMGKCLDIIHNCDDHERS
jgi:hypothetical protein